MTSQSIEYLRDATRELHEQLEACSLSRELMKPDVTETVVQEFLGASYDCLALLEPQLLNIWNARQLEELWGYRPECACLQQDIGRRATPAPAPLPDPTRDSCYAAGSLYVLLGARFGRRVIAAHLRKHRPQLVDRLRYFTVNDSPLAGDWHRFRTQLEQHCDTERQLTKAAGGARDVFTAFLQRWRCYQPVFRQSP